MVDNTKVILEDKLEYIVVDRILENDYSYVYLINKHDDSDLAVRKEIVNENEEHYLVGLKDEEEVEHALNLFLEKHPEE